jgi:hypothetical protein
MTEFFVIMQKRDDGKVYADLHKSLEKVYLTREEAEKTQAAYDKETSSFRNSFHIVRLFACTEEEMAEVNKVFQTVLELSKA